MTRSFLFVLGSARPEGNTEILARKAAEQLPPDVEQRWLDLADHVAARLRGPAAATATTDGRPVGNDAAVLLDATLERDGHRHRVAAVLVLALGHRQALPRLLGRLAGDAGDRLQGDARGPHPVGRHRARHREEVVVAEPLIGTLRNTAAFFPMRFGGVLLGNGSKPGDVLEDTEAWRAPRRSSPGRRRSPASRTTS